MIQIIILLCFVAARIAMMIVGIVREIVRKHRYMHAMNWLLIAVGVALIAIVYITVDKMMGGLMHG